MNAPNPMANPKLAFISPSYFSNINAPISMVVADIATNIANPLASFKASPPLRYFPTAR